MLPGLTPKNLTDGRFTDAESRREFPMTHLRGKSPNLSNVFFGKFRQPGTLASRLGPMFHLVLAVAQRSIPTQIVKRIIEAVAVIVAGVNSCRSLPDESDKHQTVDRAAVDSTSPISLIKVNIAVTFMQVRFKLSELVATLGRCSTGKNLAGITNKIPRIAGDFFDCVHDGLSMPQRGF